MTHGQHAEASQLFRSVEHHWWESTGHFGVQANLDTRLDLVLTLDQQIQELLGVDYRFTEVRHEANQSRVPFVHDLEVTEADEEANQTTPSLSTQADGTIELPADLGERGGA